MKDKILEALVTVGVTGLLAYFFDLPAKLWIVVLVCLASIALFVWLPWPHRTWRLPRTDSEIQYVISFRTWRGAFLLAVLIVLVFSLAGYSSARQYSSWFASTVTPTLEDDAFLKKAKITVKSCSGACVDLAESSREKDVYFVTFGSGGARSVLSKELLDALAKEFSSHLSDAMMALALAIALLGWVPLFAFELRGTTMLGQGVIKGTSSNAKANKP